MVHIQYYEKLNIPEIWVDVKGWDDTYQISNWGNFRSKDRVVTQTSRNGNQFDVFKKGQPIKSTVMKINGYRKVNLYIRGGDRRVTRTIHRLVAEHFIPNPDNLPEINHKLIYSEMTKEENKQFNHISNLEWCTPKQNGEHQYKVGLNRGRKGAEHVSSKEIAQYDLNMNEIARYESTRDCSEKTGFYRPYIMKCCNGEKQFYKGYIWKYI